MQDFKSHFRQDFLAYCTRPVSVHLAMACIGCSFNSYSVFFAQFKTTTKSHENYVFLYPFSSMAIYPQNNDFFKFYTGKLYGSTGMKTAGKKQNNQAHTYDKEESLTSSITKVHSLSSYSEWRESRKSVTWISTFSGTAHIT